MAKYHMHLQVLSSHCDSTGILHFSRYHDMAWQVAENWFDEALDWSFARMQGHDRLAVTVVHCDADFPAPSRLGDHLSWTLRVARLGKSAMDVVITARCGGETRGTMAMSLVLTSLGVMSARPWPETVRARTADYLTNSAPV